MFAENLALNKPTWQLHPIPYTSSSVYAQSWTSDKAVEGLKKNLTGIGNKVQWPCWFIQNKAFCKHQWLIIQYKWSHLK